MQCCDRFLYYYILTVISPHQPFQNRTIPCLVLNLPPLSKGGGLTARHKLFLCCVCLRYIRLFYFLDESREHIQNLNTQIMDLEQNPESENTINEIFRTIPLAFRRGVGLPLPLHQCLQFSECFKTIKYQG